MDENKTRDLDDVNEMLKLAKLGENDVLSTSQTVYFTSDNLNCDNFKFLELDQHLLEEIKQGQTLYIKGDDDENVVLCTKDRTYDVTGAETSNSLLLVKNMAFFDDLKDGKERALQTVTVSGVFYDYLSVTPGKPHLKKLRDLLDKSVYKGPEHEYEIKNEDLYGYDDLIKIIQASDQELESVLKQMNVVTINGKIRLLDVEYHFRALSYMLKLIEENSWNLDEIDFDETLNSLRDIIPETILKNLFDKYTTESKIVDGLQLYSYKEREICRFFAQILLYGAGKFNLEEFLQAWRESVPEGMTCDEELLHGIAIIDRKSDPPVISAFPEEELPEEINARFNKLFKAKEKWTVPEITPYIQRVATDKMDVNALLAKFARASNSQGVKFYSAKHAK
ncbi:sister chromatid cohesion protein DCC1 [Tribolium castaneum]|uniref:Sister chromatid cohesion protein DCC1 n=1 Tax=Tribolium castaneum TaxID=7070 RepID=D6WSW4_TRICA|nr:PREDICTED: sister chromatid cohesion protein DCC1 [Tribolium castaneum]EFA07653.2 Sister chromatid cohesion protein DCC1-like Protein [Tribolium castaneum]|eukprot:XP_968072.1 PREDICTED: sister chromatid cohesion protein DCC1 [Tribolium castaneum]